MGPKVYVLPFVNVGLVDCVNGFYCAHLRVSESTACEGLSSLFNLF